MYCGGSSAPVHFTCLLQKKNKTEHDCNIHPHTVLPASYERSVIFHLFMFALTIDERVTCLCLFSTDNMLLRRWICLPSKVHAAGDSRDTFTNGFNQSARTLDSLRVSCLLLQTLTSGPFEKSAAKFRLFGNNKKNKKYRCGS